MTGGIFTAVYVASSRMELSAGIGYSAVHGRVSEFRGRSSGDAEVIVAFTD